MNPLPYIVGGLAEGAIYGMAAMGIVFTYKVSRVVNFAYGANAMFCAYSYWQLNFAWHVPAAIAIPLTILVEPAILALLSERFVYRRLEGASLFAKTAASIGLLLAFYGLSLYFWNSPLDNDTLTVPSVFPDWSFRLPGVTVSGAQVGIICSAVVIVVALTLYLRATASGVALRAVVINRDLAEMRGINALRVTKLSWIVSYVISAIAGVLLASFVGNDPTTLTLVVVYALAAAALGRLLSLPLAMLGGLLLGLADNLMLGYIPLGVFLSQLRLALPFVLLFVALVIFAKKLVATGQAESRTALMADLAGAALRRKPAVKVLFLRLIPILVAIAILKVIDDSYALSLLSAGAAYGVIFLSYRIFTATTGMVSLAQAAFAGIGAFTAADLITGSLHVPWGLAIVVGGIVSGIAGAVVALPTVRLRGVFLVIATLAFAQLITSVLFASESFTGGISGKTFPRPEGFTSAFSYLMLVIVIFLVIGIVCEIFQYSVTGRELQADLGSGVAARSIGLRPERSRLLAFVLSASVAGVGGALLASQVQTVSPSSWDTVSTAFLWLVLVASAGLGSTIVMLEVGIVSSIFPPIVTDIFPSLDQAYVAIFGVLGLIALRVPGGFNGIEERFAYRIHQRFLSRRALKAGGAEPPVRAVPAQPEASKAH